MSRPRRGPYPRRLDDSDEPTELLGLPAFGFAEPGELRHKLTALVLDGTKTATSALVAEYLIDGEPFELGLVDGEPDDY